MSGTRTIAAVGGTVALIWLLTKSTNLLALNSTAKSLVVKVKDFKMPKINGKLIPQLKLEATNPTNKTLTIEHIFLDIKDDTGQGIAEIRDNTQIPIGPNQVTPISLDITGVNVTTLILNALKQLFLAATGQTAKINITGTIRADGVLTNYNESITLHQSDVPV